MNLAHGRGSMFNILLQVAPTMLVKEENAFETKLKYVIVDLLNDPLEELIIP